MTASQWLLLACNWIGESLGLLGLKDFLHSLQPKPGLMIPAPMSAASFLQQTATWLLRRELNETGAVEYSGHVYRR